MPTYGIMHDDGTFEPLGQAPQYAPAQGQVAYSAYNQQQSRYQQRQGNAYGVPYNNAPRYGQRFYGPGGTPTNVAVGFANGPRVRYNYQPRYTGNGYAPRGYNTNMNYGPWYGQQSYAIYPPYAPYQPRYEWMPGSNGQPVAVRLGEYQREQPVAYETMFNSQGIPVQVPVYAPMNNSARPVRVGVSPDGQPYGNVNYQAASPQQTTQRRSARGTLAAGVDYPDLGIYWDYSTNRHVSGTPRARDIADVVQNRVAITDTEKVPVTDQTAIVTEDAVVPVTASQEVVPDANGTLAGRIAAKEQEIAELRKNTATFGTGSAILEDAERELKELKKEQSTLTRRMRGEIYTAGGRYSE